MEIAAKNLKIMNHKHIADVISAPTRNSNL